MAVACTINGEAADVPCGEIKSMTRKVGRLLLCLFALWLFMFQVAPWMEQSSMIQPLARFIDEREIEANMYFYTEVEAFSEANINMDNTMKYMPRMDP